MFIYKRQLKATTFARLLSGNREFQRITCAGREIIPGGKLFELFMYSACALDVDLLEWVNYDIAFSQAIQFAAEQGLDTAGLQQNKCYARVLFAELAQLIPSGERSDLRMYCTVGTHLDRFHGIDFLFILGDSYVAVDSTLDAFHVSKTRRSATHIVEFSHFQLRQLGNQFLRQVAGTLLSRKYRLPQGVYEQVYPKSERAYVTQV